MHNDFCLCYWQLCCCVYIYFIPLIHLFANLSIFYSFYPSIKLINDKRVATCIFVHPHPIKKNLSKTTT